MDRLALINNKFYLFLLVSDVEGLIPNDPRASNPTGDSDAKILKVGSNPGD